MASASAFRPGSSRRYIAIVGLGCLVVALLSLLPTAMIANDGSVFTAVGRAWLAGQVPYRDLLVFKPPLIFLADGLGAEIGREVGLGVVGGVRLASAMACAVAGVAVASLARRYEVRPSAAAAFGFGTAAILSGYQFAAGGGLSEPPAFAFALAAWAVIESGSNRGRLLITGALGAAALGFSLLAIPFLAGAALAVVQPLWEHRRRKDVADIGVVFVGAAFVLVPIVAWFAAAGALNAMIDALIVYNGVYASAGCGGPIGLCASDAWLRVIALYALPLVPLWFFALAGLRRSRPVRPLAVLILGSVLALLLLRRHPWFHYWLPAYIGPLVPAAIGLEQALRRHQASRQWSLVGSGPAKLDLVVALTIFAPLLALDGFALATEPPIYPHSNEAPAVAAIIRQQPPGPLFVWADEAQLYLLADRVPASRYPHIWGLRLPGYTSEERVREACVDLATSRAVVVIDDTDAPDIFGKRPLSAGLDPAWYLPLARLVMRDWVEVGRVGSHQVLTVRPEAAPSAGDCEA